MHRAGTIGFGTAFDGIEQRQQRFKEQAAEMRARLKNYKRGVIDPRESKWIGWWDGTSFILLIFVAIFTPWEVTFINGGAFWMAANVCVTAFFAFDVVLQFFVMYFAGISNPEPNETSSSPAKPSPQP